MWLLIILSMSLTDVNDKTISIVEYQTFEQCNEVKQVLIDQTNSQTNEEKNYNLKFECALKL